MEVQPQNSRFFLDLIVQVFFAKTFLYDANKLWKLNGSQDGCLSGELILRIRLVF